MEKTIKLSVEQARKLYATAQDEFKALLEANFSQEELRGSIMDRIENFTDILLLTPHVYSTAHFSDSLTEDEINRRQAKLIVKVLNEGWEADWDNEEQPKYFIRFYGPNPLLFAITCWNTGTHVGSRDFVFKSKELAKFAWEKFPEIFKSIA